MLISTSSLSAKARKAWRAAQKVEGSEVIIDKRAQEAVPWYVTADLNQYTEANKKRFYEAVELAARVQDFIDYDGPDRTGYAERYALGLGISPQSLYRYMKNVLEANAWALKLEKEDGKSRDYWNDLRLLKETVRNALNRAERREFFSDAQDSTSCLTALLHFKDTPNVEFSFDVAITTKNKNGNYMRLIHNKNVYALGLDQYTWNEVPNSHQVKDRADKLKRAGLWQKVRDRYLEKKNMYLFRPDHNHPSFVVYVEAVNEVYSRYFNRGGGYSVQSIF